MDKTGMTESVKDLNHIFDRALWAAHTLFERNKVSGSSGNFSFRFGEEIYMTGGGCCFGTLEKEDFAVLDRKFRHISGPKPSKEWPLHCILYQKDEDIGAVLHTHSFYSALWSCLETESSESCIPAYTPYLKMKLGNVVRVPYAPPGSQTLFRLFEQSLTDARGYLLANHGPVVGAADVEEAFYALEELEESAKTAWFLEGNAANAKMIKEKDRNDTTIF